MDKKLYLAVIGDIINSKKIAERDKVQEILENKLEFINDNCKKHIVSKFVITSGDEMQGLLFPAAPVYEILCDILESLYPVRLRFGLGYGTLSTRGIKDLAIGMDGPAFHYAREAINIAHGLKGYAIVLKSELLSNEVENQINAFLGLLSVIRNLWNDKFHRIIKPLREEMRQQEIAELYGATQPYISELAGKAYWKEIRAYERELETLMLKIFTS